MTHDVASSPLAASRPGSAAFRNRFAILLVALILLLLAAPIVRALGPPLHPKVASGVITATFAAILLAGVHAIGQSRLSRLVAVFLVAPTAILLVLRLFLAQTGIAVGEHLVAIVFLGYVIAAILRHIFSDVRVNLDVICGSLCVYLLLGVLWALAYSLLEVLHPGSFAFSVAAIPENVSIEFGGERSIYALYYSFVTMTTLGYGDIVPASSAARMFAAIQAVAGQLYIAVLVARLVGLHVAHSAGAETPSPNA